VKNCMAAEHRTKSAMDTQILTTTFPPYDQPKLAWLLMRPSSMGLTNCVLQSIYLLPRPLPSTHPVLAVPPAEMEAAVDDPALILVGQMQAVFQIHRSGLADHQDRSSPPTQSPKPFITSWLVLHLAKLATPGLQLTPFENVKSMISVHLTEISTATGERFFQYTVALIRYVFSTSILRFGTGRSISWHT
jgi:hypothetical protein